MDKAKLLEKMDKEIAFAKTTGMPIFVMGLNRARDIIEKMEDETPVTDHV